MPILINQKFPRCTLCGKILPLKVEPIVIREHRMCSERCVQLLHKLHPDQLSEQEMQDRIGAR
jgi:hypothetical protein